MIFTDRTITVQKGVSSINDPIILYRGDKEVQIRFTLNEGSPFRFSSGASPNIIEKTEAAYGQLVIKTPNDLPSIFSEIVPTNEGKIIFTITAEMIDEITEVGNYTFQIRLFDESMNSRATLPEVVDGIEIREPIATEDVTNTNEVNVATVGYALTTAGAPEDTFDSEGNYLKTNWATGDRITAAKLNKIEDGIDGVNQKIASVGTGGSGLTTSQINALDAMFKVCAYTTDDISTQYNAFKVAFGISGGGTETPDPTPTTYSITNNLTNCANSNSLATVEENTLYSATLTANDGYALDTVTVTMGGVDITSTAVNDGVITISAVTGNIVITATASVIASTNNPLDNLIVDIPSTNYYLDDTDSLYKLHNNANDEIITVYTAQKNTNPFWNFPSGELNGSALSTTGTTFQSLTGATTFLIDCVVDKKSLVGQTNRLNGIIIFQNVFNNTWDNYNSQSVSLPYINTSGESASYKSELYQKEHTLPSNWNRYIMTIVLEEDGQINTYLDNMLSATIPAPSDFARWDYVTMTNVWNKLILLGQKVDYLIEQGVDANFIVRNGSTSIDEIEAYHTYSEEQAVALTNDVSALSLEEDDSFF